MKQLLFALLLSIVSPTSVRADDWPTYRHDNSRSGITAEQLPTPLAEAWVFESRHAPAPAWEPPRSVPVEGILELPRVRFDDAFHVVAAGSSLYFGSSADHKVYCLDANTGKVRWTFFTGGPVRLAPTVVGDRVYVGSDDGFIYCLAAANGAAIWQQRVGPRADQLIGHGKMISLWPVRTGVLVDGGVAYCGAGLFPSEGVYLEARRADSGRLVWRNDAGGEATGSRLSPQGYLLATADKLFVPQGRATPATFSRQDGRMALQAVFGKTVGGTDALIAGNALYTGTEEIIGYDAKTRAKVAWFDGRKVVITPDTVYLTNADGILAMDREAYAPLGALRFQLRDDRAALARDLTLPKKEKTRLVAAIALDKAKLAGQPAGAELEKEIRDQEAKLDAVIDQIAATEARIRQLDAKVAKTNADMLNSVKWKFSRECPDALILAGDLVIVGGQKYVLAANAATGKKVWEAHVPGKAKSLAVANGRLFASTDTGAIHCFGAASPGRIVEPTTYQPDPKFAAEAEQIVRESGVTRGFALVLGCGTGQLAFELAKRTELHVVGVEPDETKVGAARRALDAAGVYGTRVVVDHGPLDRLPYSPYFADLIVSDAANPEVERVLKPCGGVAMVGKTKTVRGPLPGAGSWTHEYANAANTACGDDTFLKCPLGLLWFGDPGPLGMVSRHARAAAPLSVNGVMLVQTENGVTAYDAYNGLKLWERAIAKVVRTLTSQESSNLAADAGNFYVVTGNQCLRLDLRTGELRATYIVPDKSPRWGHLAVVDGRLIGTGAAGNDNAGSLLFAYDTATGKLAWTHPATRVPHSTISVAEGRVFFVEIADVKKGKPVGIVHPVTALNLADGNPVWQQSIDLTGCLDDKYWGALGTMVHDGVLVLFGVYTDGHFWKDFFAKQFGKRRILTLNAKDGSLLWSKNIAYRVRPLIVGNTLHAEPWAFDLRTGEQRQRVNPITGALEPWQFARPGHHCGLPIAAPNVMFFRSYYLGYYDLYGDFGTMTFGGQRPGCWINFIPANGLAMMPEASSGCMCPFPNMCTVVFAPRAENRAWAEYSLAGPITPVQHLALHLGAPGDRRDDAGTLWLAYPRTKGSLVLQFKVNLRLAGDGANFAYSPDFMPIAGTESPWLYTFGYRGVQRCEVPVGDGCYTVRLGFAEIDDCNPGERVFDIALQGQPVLKDFDIVQQAGGTRKAIIKEFTGIEVAGDLAIELTPKKSSQPSLLQTIEVIKTK